MILCCGEALIDMIPAQTGSGEKAYLPLAGGAVYNTAIALGRLECPAGMLTGLSTDLFGQQLATGLTASNVDTSLCITSSRPTTLAFVELTGGHASYTFYDENSAGRLLSPEELPPLPTSVTALYLGGISLAVEPCAEAYAALAADAGDRVVMIDPNIRPGFIKDENRYRDRLDRMTARADILKVSDEDLHWLEPGDATLADKAARLQAKGAGIVLVTKGKDGALGFLQNGQQVSVHGQSVTVVDTVGAGDTFNAGVLASLQDRKLLSREALAKAGAEDISQALAFGAKVAAVTVSRAGANPPWRSELTAA
ncbi:carbohydrate kinase family protein [Roseibium litorale]|uniref:Carbohydrate kinase n=1 Tax=Roseibium litorale TaxID=2803841 RepID=A0ABR9CGU6_9HYPH|nr:carbohydrate kinase [Roseibium litorale]MBD8889998.1 carbohydrate kinase [Roseibium litorale]